MLNWNKPMRLCVICEKRLGDKKAPILKACKKHQHILDTVFPNREDQTEVTGMAFLDAGIEKPVRTLEDFEKAWNTGLYIVR